MSALDTGLPAASNPDGPERVIGPAPSILHITIQIPRARPPNAPDRGQSDSRLVERLSKAAPRGAAVLGALADARAIAERLHERV